MSNVGMVRLETFNFVVALVARCFYPLFSTVTSFGA